MTLFQHLAVTVLALLAAIVLASRRPRGAGLWLPFGTALVCVIGSATLFAARQAPLSAVLVLSLMPFAGSILVIVVMGRVQVSRLRWSLLVGLGGLTGLVTGIPAAVFLS